MMAIDVQNISRGMDTYSAYGEKIGTVIRVQPPQPAEGTDRPDLDFDEGSLAVPTDVGEGRPVSGFGGPAQAAGARAAGRQTPARAEEPEPQAPAPVRSGFILVEDQGVLGVGAGGLRVPFDSVIEVVPGRRIVLDCTRAQAVERYGGGPSLEIDPDAPVTPY